MLVEQVTTWLEELWSPQEISSRLRLEFPDDLMMQVSHETIYQSLFVQGRGELRRELARCLRSGRTSRRSQGRVDGRGKIPNMVMISSVPSRSKTGPCPGLRIRSPSPIVVCRPGSGKFGSAIEPVCGDVCGDGVR